MAKNVLLAALVLAALVRGGTFFLGHAGGGDQSYYTAAAMKLEKTGFKGYTLRDTAFVPRPGGFVEYTHDTDPAHSAVEAMKSAGLHYYDTPVLHVPPLFSAVIRFSHAVFGPKAYVLEDKAFPFHRGWHFHRAEFYATVVPFTASLATLMLLAFFVLGRAGTAAAALAVFALAVSPVDILAADRVWADSLVTFFVFAAFILYLEAADRRRIWPAAAAGVFLGLGILTKGSALFFLPFALLHDLRVEKKLSLRFVALAGAALVISLPWFWLLYKTYGNPFYFPAAPLPGSGPDAKWFEFVTNRPWFMYPVNLFFQNPLFLFAAAPLAAIARRRSLPEENLMIAWVVFFMAILLTVWPWREERYLLPAYPALAALAGLGMSRVRKALEARRKNLGSAALTLALTVAIPWSLELAYMYLYIWQNDTLPVPF